MKITRKCIFDCNGLEEALQTHFKLYSNAVNFKPKKKKISTTGGERIQKLNLQQKT